VEFGPRARTQRTERKAGTAQGGYSSVRDFNDAGQRRLKRWPQKGAEDTKKITIIIFYSCAFGASCGYLNLLTLVLSVPFVAITKGFCIAQGLKRLTKLPFKVILSPWKSERLITTFQR
jgi:hypothetical protein